MQIGLDQYATQGTVRVQDISAEEWRWIAQRHVPVWNVMRDWCHAHWTHVPMMQICPTFGGFTPEAAQYMQRAVQLLVANRSPLKPTSGYDWAALLNPDEYHASEYQAAGMDRLWEIRKGILADDVGLGKTPQSLAIIARHHGDTGKPSMVVTTASTKGQWYDEAERFTPSLNVKPIQGEKAERHARMNTTADIYILNYEQTIMPDVWEWMKAKSWGVVVFDEAYRLGGHQSKTTQRGIEIARITDRLLLLNATPIERGLENLFSQMQLIDRRVFGSFEHFKSRFMLIEKKPPYIEAMERKRGKRTRWRPKVIGYTNIVDAKIRLRPYMIRRTAGEVSLPLPGLVAVPIYTRMTAADDQEYGRAVREAFNSKIATALIPKIRLAMVKSKAEDLSARLRGELANEAVIVFSQYERAIHEAARILAPFGPAVISGSVSAKERSTIVRLFGTQGHRLLLMTEAGSRGLNLQAAGTVVNLDLPWTHSQLRQRVGRIRRIGQTRDSVRVLNYVAEKRRGQPTIDHWLARIVMNRRDLHVDVLGDDDVDEMGIEQLANVRFRDVLRYVEQGDVEAAVKLWRNP